MVNSDISRVPATLTLYVRAVEDTGPLTIYHLDPDLTRDQRLAVLACLREQHPGASIAMVGSEIAVGGAP
jgi:hypothetical protein